MKVGDSNLREHNPKTIQKPHFISERYPKSQSLQPKKDKKKSVGMLLMEDAQWKWTHKQLRNHNPSTTSK